MAYYLGVRTERTGFVSEVLDPNLKRITRPVLNAFRGRPPVVQRLVLQMPRPRLDSLYAFRDSVLQAGWLHSEANPAFPVHCIFGEYEFQGELQLREGPAEELALMRWPFRLRTAAGDTLYDMRSFDMVPVNGIEAAYSWLMQNALGGSGSPTYGHAMVELQLNREDLGLYTLEGRTDSTSIAKWGRGPGPVLRFDDALLAGTRAAMENRLFGSLPLPQGDWLAAPIIVSGTINEEDEQADPRTTDAMEQLEAFRSGSVALSNVLDVPSTARMFALADLLGGQRTTHWWNLRFLPDTATGVLIPFPLKAHAGEPIESISALQLGIPITFRPKGPELADRLFNDTAFYNHYIAYLDTFVQDGWLEALLARLGARAGQYEKVISAEYPQERMDTTIFLHDRTVIQQTLRPRDLVLAYTQNRQGDRRRLALANVHALPVQAIGVVSGTDTVPFPRPVLLLPRETDKPLSYTIVNIRIPKEEAGHERLLVQLVGLKEMRSMAIRNWSTFTAN